MVAEVQVVVEEALDALDVDSEMDKCCVGFSAGLEGQVSCLSVVPAEVEVQRRIEDSLVAPTAEVVPEVADHSTCRHHHRGLGRCQGPADEEDRRHWVRHQGRSDPEI